MHQKHMQHALTLATRGRGHVSPNPLVGAVIVRDGEVVGEGWHAALGGDHAEVAALRAAGARARGADLYVTLEPCNHHGRTPPCTDALVAAGVRRVVMAVRDPNPRVSGGGADALEARGVEVHAGLLEEEARALNRVFFTWAQARRPFVTLKTALTLDGRIACHTGQSRWITGEAARRRVHEERAAHDAILVGVGTVLADDPRLNARLDVPARDPRVVILDSTLRTPPEARAVAGALVYCRDAHLRAALAAVGATVIEVVADDDGRPRVEAVLTDLAERGITSVLVEGGGRVQRAFLGADRVDRVLSFIAPVIVGGVSAPTPLGRWEPEDAPVREQSMRPLQGVSVSRVGDDVLVEGTLQECWR